MIKKMVVTRIVRDIQDLPSLVEVSVMDNSGSIIMTLKFNGKMFPPTIRNGAEIKYMDSQVPIMR